MKKEIVTTKITKESLKCAKLISAHTGEKQYEVIERVLKTELKKVQEEKNA